MSQQEYFKFELFEEPVSRSVFFELQSSENGKVTLAVKAMECENINGAAIEIAYDPGQLHFVSCEAGDAFSPDDSKVFFISGLCQDKEGDLLIGAARAKSSEAIELNGIIASISFDVNDPYHYIPIEFNSVTSELKSTDSDQQVRWIGGKIY